MAKNFFDKIRPTFSEGGKLSWLHSSFDAFETFFFVPNRVTKKGGVHVKDCVDLKRILIIVVLSLVPALLFGIWNLGEQHSIVFGLGWGFWEKVWYGFVKIIPLYLVSYIVGLGIEFASAQMKGHEVSEGYLVSGFIIPLIVPVDVPWWMLTLAVAFAVIIGKEVFGGTGMNIWNPALLARAFLFFSYPSKMSGDSVWVGGLSKALEGGTPWKGGEVVDALSGATPLSHASLDGLNERDRHPDRRLHPPVHRRGQLEDHVLFGARRPLRGLARHFVRRDRHPVLGAAADGRLRLRYGVHGHRPRDLGPDRMRQVDLRLPDRRALHHRASLQPGLSGRHDARHPADEHVRSADRPLCRQRQYQPPPEAG